MSRILIVPTDEKDRMANTVRDVCDKIDVPVPDKTDLAFSWIIECINSGYELEIDDDPDYFNDQVSQEADRLIPILDFEKAIVWVELQQYRAANPQFNEVSETNYIQAFAQRLYDIAYEIMVEISE